ncbi:DNA methylase [Candidatus Woesearchaeota archaeon]|nr:DNA methylase [Candidatus Woesearchaeota archaeon]
MNKKMSKSGLGIVLSKLKKFENPEVRAEQYPMDSEIGAEVLWNAFLMGDIKGKVIVDLGCGTGILGIGALFLGAKRVFLVDNDENALKIAKNNLFLAKSESSFRKKGVFLEKDVKEFREKCDVVLQNPPFGVKSKGADKAFLEAAFRITKVVYSFHKLNTQEFIENFAESEGFNVTHLWRFDFPIKSSMFFHKKRIYRFKVGCWRFVKGD